MEKTLFTTYNFNLPDDDTESNRSFTFTIDLTPIVESLSLAQSNFSNSSGTSNGPASAAQCTISYEGENSPFVLIFEDSKISERCELSTFLNIELAHLLKENNTPNFQDDEDETDARNGFEIDQNSIQLECIIKSDVLYDALKDLKDLETEEVYFYFANDRSQTNRNGNGKANRVFAIVSKSMMGNSLLSLPNEISILEKLKVYSGDERNGSNTKDSLSAFKFNLFHMCFKAIRLSNKCKIQKDFNNLLNLNLLCFKNESGSILPKNYSGSVINFKIFENVSAREDVNSIRRFIDKSLNLSESNGSGNQSKRLVKDPLIPPSIIQDTGIDVPIFL